MDEKTKIRISKKFSFGVIALSWIFWALDLVQRLDYPESYKFYIIISSQLSIVFIAVAYITGQAKIDMNIQAGFGDVGKTKRR